MEINALIRKIEKCIETRVGAEREWTSQSNLKSEKILHVYEKIFLNLQSTHVLYHAKYRESLNI